MSECTNRNEKGRTQTLAVGTRSVFLTCSQSKQDCSAQEHGMDPLASTVKQEVTSRTWLKGRVLPASWSLKACPVGVCVCVCETQREDACVLYSRQCWKRRLLWSSALVAVLPVKYFSELGNVMRRWNKGCICSQGTGSLKSGCLTWKIIRGFSITLFNYCHIIDDW